MTILLPKRIEDYILNLLKKGPLSCLEIVAKIQELRPQTTKQAVYAALRILKKQEEVIILKGTASLNLAWLNQMESYFESAKSHYLQGNNQGSILGLEDKEKIKYYFQDAHKADIFWTHAYYLLLEALSENEPVFLYNPHECFLLARRENEKEVIHLTAQKNHPFLLTSGHNNFLDQAVRKYFDGEMSQYNVLPKPLFSENNYYLNIFGDFLIEVWMDKNIADAFEKLYLETSKWHESVEIEAKKIFAANGKMKIVVSRNKKKAERLKKTLRKGFAIRIKK